MFDLGQLALAAYRGPTDLPPQDVPTPTVEEVTGGRGADVTFEVTGVQGGIDLIGDVTRMSGKVVLVGFHQGAPRLMPLWHWNWMAYDLRNAHFREVTTIMRCDGHRGAAAEGGPARSSSRLFTHPFPPRQHAQPGIRGCAYDEA